MDILTCPGCKKLFNKPFLLHCKHSLCKTCCEIGFITAQSQLQCPACKAYTRVASLQLLQLNGELNEIVTKALKYQSQVPDVQVQNQSLVNQQNLQFIDLNNYQLLNNSQALQMVQRGADKVKPVTEAHGDLSQQLPDLIRQLSKNIPQIKFQLQQTQESQEELNTSYNKSLQQIKDFYQNLKEIIIDQENQQISALKSEHQIQSQQFDNYKQQLTQFQEIIAVISEANLNQLSPLQVCEIFIRMKTTAQQITEQHQQMFDSPPKLLNFNGNELLYELLSNSGKITQQDNYSIIQTQLQNYLNLQKNFQVYDYTKERQMDDDSSGWGMVVERVLLSNKQLKQQTQEELQQNQFAQKYFDNLGLQDLEFYSIATSLQLKIIEQLPHEYLSAINQYLNQVDAFYEYLQQDLQFKINTLKSLEKSVSSNQTFKSEISLAGVYQLTGCKQINSQLQNINQILVKFTSQFQQLHTQLQQKCLIFIQNQHQQFKTNLKQYLDEFQQQIVKYDEKQHQLVQQQEELKIIHQKYLQQYQNNQSNSNNQQDLKSNNLKLKQYEQNYIIKQQQLKQDIEKFLSFELNMRRKLKSVFQNLQKLDSQRLVDFDSYVLMFNQIVYHQLTVQFNSQIFENFNLNQQLINNNQQQQVQLIQQVVKQSISDLLNDQQSNLIQQAGCAKFDKQYIDSQDVIQSLLVCSQNLKNTQISDQVNQLKQSVALLSQNNQKNESNKQQAPIDAIGLCRSEFDYDVSKETEQSIKEMKNDILPLKENQLYWIYEYDSDGWSVISHIKYPNIRQLAPSNYLELQNCYGQYRWSGSVLQQCGGKGLGTEKTSIQQILQSKVDNILNENLPLVVAQFDFDPEDSDELQLKEGDQVTVVEKLEGGQWIRGCNLRTGKTGLYPANHVE